MADVLKIVGYGASGIFMLCVLFEVYFFLYMMMWRICLRLRTRLACSSKRWQPGQDECKLNRWVRNDDNDPCYWFLYTREILLLKRVEVREQAMLRKEVRCSLFKVIRGERTYLEYF